MMEERGWNVLPLSECRRSNQRIIDLYSKLKSNNVPAITSHGVEDKGIPIVVYKYDDGNIKDIIRALDRKSTRLNSSHANISYAVFCLKKKKNTILIQIYPLNDRIDM